MRAFLDFPGVLFGRLMNSALFSRISGHSWTASLFLSAIAFFFAFPSYDVSLVLHEFDVEWGSLFTQASDPFSDHSDLYHPEKHNAKLAFRFVPALLLRALGVDSIAGGLIVQACLVPVFYLLLFLLLKSLIPDRRLALAFCLPVCFLMAGHVHASDYRGIFDGLALTLLLAATFLRRTGWMIIPLVLACFTDERALVASPCLILLDLYVSGHTGSWSRLLAGARSRTVLFVFAAWLLYFAIRYMLGRANGLHTPPVDVVYYFQQNLYRLGYAIYIALEGFYIVGLVVFGLLFRQKAYGFTWLLICSFLLTVGVALCVVDVNRSLSYLLLWVVLTMLIIHREVSPTIALNMIGWSVLISMAYDDYYPLPAQVYRMAFITKSLVPLDAWVVP